MLSNENLNALESLLNLPTIEEIARHEIVVMCGGCTSLHHNN